MAAFQEWNTKREKQSVGKFLQYNSIYKVKNLMKLNNTIPRDIKICGQIIKKANLWDKSEIYGIGKGFTGNFKDKW